jgi:hypothetical protein
MGVEPTRWKANGSWDGGGNRSTTGSPIKRNIYSHFHSTSASVSCLAKDYIYLATVTCLSCCLPTTSDQAFAPSAVRLSAHNRSTLVVFGEYRPFPNLSGNQRLYFGGCIRRLSGDMPFKWLRNAHASQLVCKNDNCLCVFVCVKI